MTIDERALGHLIEESEDLQSDAMAESRAVLPDLEDIREERRNEELDPEDAARVTEGRGELVESLSSRGLAAKGALAGGAGALLLGMLATPAAADEAVDVQILQTASSLELLAVATYGAALKLPFIKNGNDVVVEFAKTTRKQHNDHRKAFQAQTRKLGGKKQTEPNPKYVPVVEQAKPGLTDPLAVVNLAATLEEVATETYLANLALLSDKRTKALMASVMAVETQHLGTLRAVRALLEANMPDLIAIPTDVAALPAAAGSAASPDAVEDTDKASPPEEGAVQ